MLPPLVEWLQQPLLVLLAGVVGIAIAQLPKARLGALLVVSTMTFMGAFDIWAVERGPDPLLHPFLFVAREHRLPLDYRVSNWTPGDSPLRLPDQDTHYYREIRFDTP